MSDPLTLAAMPPANESSQDRDRRLRDEAEARKVSDAIDAQLKEERLASKRRKEVKVLLLGQSESGKSTTLKRASSLRVVFPALTLFQSSSSCTPPTPSATSDSPGAALSISTSSVPSAGQSRFVPFGCTSSELGRSIVDALSADYENEVDADGEPIRPGTATTIQTAEKQEQFDTIRHRLRPLLDLEGKLIRMLNGEDTSSDDTRSIASKEIYVRSNAPWKKVAAKLRGPASSTSTPEVASGHIGDDPAHTLAASKLDMITLWRDPAVREVLSKRKMRLEESSGLYALPSATPPAGDSSGIAASSMRLIG